MLDASSLHVPEYVEYSGATSTTSASRDIGTADVKKEPVEEDSSHGRLLSSSLLSPLTHHHHHHHHRAGVIRPIPSRGTGTGAYVRVHRIIYRLSNL